MKPNIALLTGGFSGEAVISYRSATTIEKNLDKDKYNVYLINVSKDGWVYRENGQQFNIDKNDFSLIVNGTKILFDLVFIAIHGTPGEDGKLQGYFDLLGIKYTGCSLATSALTFNKRYTVAVAAFAGIPVAKSVHLFKSRPQAVSDILKKIKVPVFVKPNNGGSSIGMSKVVEEGLLETAIEKAFKEDDQVLVEEMIEGREFTIGVLRRQGKVTTLPATEVKSKNFFFDFEAKYTAGKADEITPAQAPDSILNKVRETAGLVYETFNCAGTVRMDFIYNEEKDKVYLLEINTVPGQTDASLVPQQVRANNWTLEDFYSDIISEALNTK